jgi:HlyD family secretion protein
MLDQQQRFAHTWPTLSSGDDVAGPAGMASLPPPTPPWWRRRGGIIAISAGISAIAVLLLLLIIGGVFFLVAPSQRQPTTIYQYQKVARGNFSLTVNATGPLQSGIYNVVFSGTGKIAEIDVNVGQSVMQGQVLAKLDKTSLQDAVNQAQAVLLAAQTTQSNAQASLETGAAQSQANVNAAQTAVNNAQANLGKTQAQGQADVNAAQTTVSNAQASLGKTQAQGQANIAAAQTALGNAQNGLDEARREAQASIAVAFAQEQLAIKTCQSEATPPPNCVQLAQNQFNQAVAMTNAAIAAAQGQVNIAQKQVPIVQAQAAAANTTAQGQVNTAQSQLNTAMATTNANNTTAQGQVNTAQSQSNTAIATANNINTTAQGQVNTAQSQFNIAETQLQTAQHNLNNATLTAPHIGIVTVINGTVGGTPGVPRNTPATSVALPGSIFIQIVDVSSLQVQANVNEANTGNVRVGQPAQFTISAFGGRLFRGTVSAISPNAQTISNVVTYPVIINVDMTSLQGVALLPGMTANVTILVAVRPNVLLIPVSAPSFARTAAPAIISPAQAAAALNRARQMLVTLQLEQPEIALDNPVPAFVLEQSGSQFVAKPVVLGLTDGTVYEVLAGLSEGETVVVGVQKGG